ncbi:MAG: ribonuclease HI [Oscillospiraceae bacterium]|jgi:ribonuclease HI|nr:ribonuclease HI [Oscillospiraceae bacterium]
MGSDFMGGKKTVFIYADGACSGNPGPGGWGVVMRCGEKEAEYSGGQAEATNNRMELTAVIFALNKLKYPCRVVIRTDSRYITDGVTKGWAASWKRNGWVKSDKKPALNPDLWEELLRLCEIHDVTFDWIKGHAGHKENERCDKLAVKAAEEFKNVKKNPGAGFDGKIP